MIRTHFLELIISILNIHPICTILGPPKSGKTTLAKHYSQQYYPGKTTYFDLRDHNTLARLDNPMLALSSLTDQLIIIDEIQRRPDLFPILRVLADQKDKNRKFLILGSASRELLQQSSESLAGRIGYIELPPFSLFETNDHTKLWVRGGFPLSYLASSEHDSYAWRQNYITTFLERDIPALGFSIPSVQMRRFWLMLAHYHGQIFNASEIGRSLGLSLHMVRKYLDVLAGTFMVRILIPWFENLEKRQVKSPKIYFRDSGILHALLGIENKEYLNTFPKLGSFWEGFALEEVIRILGITSSECFFWATQANAELDLFVIKHGKRIGFEFKYTDSPRTTKSMHIALEDLKLDHLAIIYPGKEIFPLTEKITAYGLDAITLKTFK